MIDRRPSAALILLLFLAAFVIGSAACGKSGAPAAKAAAPAKIDNPVKEASLTSITLTAEAEKRLGLATAPVEKRILPARFEQGGEIITVPGGMSRIAAPVAGKVLAPQGGTLALAGKRFRKGEAVLRLLILPPEKDILGAREDVAVKTEDLKVARSKADRASELIKTDAVSRKAFEESQAELARATAALDAAKSKLALFDGADPAAAAEHLSSLVLASPVDGVLRSIDVSLGQAVPAGTALFEVARLDPVWIRVPIYVGDLGKVDLTKDALVSGFGGAGQASALAAKPVQGPPLSDPASASSDLYFQIPNRDGKFRIGEKVRVTVFQTASAEGLAVPAASILYDPDGGSWVYVQSGERVFTRRRVEISHFVDGLAVLTRGLAGSERVVTAGAAELFGTEFGAGK